VRVAGLSVLALLLVAYFIRFLQAFTYLPGTDAYYYAVQAQSLLDTGRLKVADHGALHYAVAALVRVGLPIEGAFRIILIAIFTLYQAGMLLLVQRLKARVQFVAALLWALSSPLLAFHAIEFPNLTLGLATIPIWFWLAMKPVRYWLLWLAMLLCASALVHPSAGAFAVLFAATASLAAARTNGAQPGKLLFTILVGVAGCSVLLTAGALANPGFTSRVLSFVRGRPGLLGLSTSAGVPNEMKFTVLAFWLLLAVLLVPCWKVSSGKWNLLAASALALPLCPDQFAGLVGLGERLSVLFPFLAVPLTVVMYDELTSGEVAERRMFVFSPNSAHMERFAIVAAVVAALLVPFRLPAYHDLLMIDDYAQYESVVDALREANVPMLIAHRGLDFFYSYRLRRDAFHFDPEPEWIRHEIWRVASRVTPEEMAYYSPPGCPFGQTAKLIHGTDYILVREDCWEQLRARLSRTENPDLYAEVWENMENPSQTRPAFMRTRYRNRGLDPFSAPR
jgi:hypothetical protein